MEMEVKVFKARILGFQGSWMSGLATLILEDLDGYGPPAVHCENAQTVRCLEGAFGNVIDNNHSVNPEGGHVGKEIFYSMDDMGLVLECFTPVDEASDELIDYYNKERE